MIFFFNVDKDKYVFPTSKAIRGIIIRAGDSSVPGMLLCIACGKPDIVFAKR